MSFQDDITTLLATARADLEKLEHEAKMAAEGSSFYRSLSECERIAREYPIRKEALRDRIASLERQLPPVAA